MGIVTQWAIRLQTSDFYGPSPPAPNTQAPHDRPPPPNIKLVDKWKMGKYGTSENVQHGGKHSTPPPPVSNHKSAPPPTRHIGTSLQENGDKRAVPPPPTPTETRELHFRKMVGWGKYARMCACHCVCSPFACSSR